MEYQRSGNDDDHVELTVRPVRAPEVAAAFGILDRVRVWLEQQGRRQRIAQTTRETYQRWQSAGANYVVTARANMVGIFSVPREPLAEWPLLEINEPVCWLRALATDPAHHGKRIGVFAVESALQIVDSPEPVYLDCVSGFLPSYYKPLGFETVAQQTRRYPGDEQAFEITLMKHPNLGSLTTRTETRS